MTRLKTHKVRGHTGHIAATRAWTLKTQARIDDYAFLRATGASVAEAAERVGVNVRTGWRYEKRLRDAS
jgi:hypothetical protein